MNRVMEDEELNLQDLIFILLFFFIIAQTMIVFKVQKDLIVTSKVDRDPELQIEEEKDTIALMIDRESNIYALAEDKETVIEAFSQEALDKVNRDRIGSGGFKKEDYYDINFDREELFLESEKQDAYREIMKKVEEIIERYKYDKPVLGLIADHRARQGTIFQVNLAVQELKKEALIDPSVKWKVLIEKTGTDQQDEIKKFQDSLSKSAATPEE